MESVKLALMKRIEEAMPEVRIDEDYGQLESQEDQYPVVFPCVLVGMGDTEWLPMANRPGIQQGKTSVTLKLAIDCYDDTSFTSGTYGKVRERRQMDLKLYKTLQRFKSARCATPLVRVKSRDYALPGYVKVFETTYAFTINDNSGQSL